MARILFHTSGSLGDLHPYMAIARALAVRGQTPWIATHGLHRARVEAAGIGFTALRPDFERFGDRAEVMRHAFDEREGSRFVVTRLVLPYLRETTDDLLRAARGADLLVSHTLSFMAPAVCEILGLPRVHTVLQPLAMFSSFDPPIIPAVPLTRWLHGAGPRVWNPLWALGRRSSRGWFRPVDALRADLGLAPARTHPLFDLGAGVPNLALFSPVLAPSQPDWPPGTLATGFPMHDRDERGRGIPERVAAFLDAGPAPLVFTLGSSAVWDAGPFYEAAAAAAVALGRRAILLVGPDEAHTISALPGGVIAVDYAPHSELFPRAAAVVHQGGIGTTGQALAAGRPTLIVPYSHDQPDNAARCARLGVARVLARRAVTRTRMTRELGALLGDVALAARAESVGRRVRAERGAEAAADAIVAALHGAAPVPRP